MEIARQKLDEITSFIGEESNTLQEANNVEREAIYVAMPYWLFQLFCSYFRTICSHSIKEEDSNIFFFGCKVQFHFKNEVVVFYRDFCRNSELFEPKIYTIN